jgi:hypothetical protein
VIAQGYGRIVKPTYIYEGLIAVDSAGKFDFSKGRLIQGKGTGPVLTR